MVYSVKLTPSAITQIQETIEYIANVLLAPEPAQSWVNHLEKRTRDLGTMPSRFPLLEREPWRSKGIRKMLVHHFIVYYFVDKKAETVWVIAVLYEKQDQLNTLRDLPNDPLIHHWTDQRLRYSSAPLPLASALSFSS